VFHPTLFYKLQFRPTGEEHFVLLKQHSIGRFKDFNSVGGYFGKPGVLILPFKSDPDIDEVHESARMVFQILSPERDQERTLNDLLVKLADMERIYACWNTLHFCSYPQLRQEQDA